MPKRRIVFDNFSGGEYGLLGETHAPPNSFTGANMVRLIDGSLAPRSGLVDLGATSVPTGSVSGFGYHATEAKVWFSMSTHVYQLPVTATGQAVATLSGTIGSPTLRVRSFATYGPCTYITVYGQGTYQLNHSTAAITAMSAAPSGRCIAIYGARVVVGGQPANPNRLSWSQPLQTNPGEQIWPTSNYVDIGSPDYPITTLTSHFGHLIIGKADGTWWELRGVLGESANWSEYWRNKRVGPNDAAISRWGTDVGGGLWYLDEVLASPVSFNYYSARTRRYESFQSQEHLSLNDYGGTITDAGLVAPIGVAAMREPGDVFFSVGASGTAYDDQGLMQQRGMWSKHTFDVAISGMVDGRDDANRRLYFCDGASTPKFYALSYDLNRPPISGNTFESLGDASSSTPVAASFTTPVFFAKDGNEVQVSSVVVNFTKWNHGYAVDNGFTVSVTPKQAYYAGDLPATTGVPAWSEDPSSASATGTNDQHTFTFSDRHANGFTITVSDIVGVSIKRMVVTFDERPMQGTA